MLLEVILLGSLLCGIQAHQGSDMNDDDFAAYVKMHDDFREKHGESFGKGCVNGAAVGAATGAGFQALCIGCVASGAANVAQDMVYPPERETNKGKK